MNVLSKPLGSKKRALLIAIQHVRCKLGSKFSGLSDLHFAHRDAQAFRNHLIASCGYEADNIIIMMDLKDHPEHLWPTRGRILRQIERLVSGAPENCYFLFYFSGHGHEEEGGERARMRVDGRDGEIVCADGKPILDYTLHEHLIEPLKKVNGSKLFALFDCCHSETLLDLQRGNGPNFYSRAWRIGPGQLFKDLVTIIINLLKLNKKCHLKRHKIPPPPRRANTIWRNPPMSDTHEVEKLSVICLSACRDGQLAYDDCKRGLTFTKCFIDAIADKPSITWTELRDTLKEVISEILAGCGGSEETCLGNSSSNDGFHGSWVQEPRYCTTCRMDLTRKVSL